MNVSHERTISGILASVIILGALAILLSAFTDAGKIISNIITGALGDFSLFSYWTELLVSSEDVFRENASLAYAVSEGSGIAVGGLISMILNTILASAATALCIRISNAVLWGNIGNKVITTLIGATVGVLLCSGAGGLDYLLKTGFIQMGIEIGIILIGIGIMISGKLPHPGNHNHRMRPLLLILIDAFVSGMIFMYLAVLTLVMRKRLQPTLPWVTGFAIFVIVTCIIAYFLSNHLEKH